MPYKDPEKKKKSDKSRYEKYYKNNPKYKQKNKLYRETNKDRINEKQIQLRTIKKIRVLLHYGNGVMQCACCGEKEIDFLTLDHINNDGTKHRKNVGGNMYFWVIKNNFPPIFQILCMNCNFAKGKHKNNGICPHKIHYSDRPNYDGLIWFFQNESSDEFKKIIKLI